MRLPLVCFVVCAVLIFGFRIALQYGRTRDHGLRLGKQGGTLVGRAATAMQATALFGVLAVTVMRSFFSLPGQLDLGPMGTAAGVAVCTFATAITMVSQYQMGDAWRIGVDASEENELVTRGMFSVSRNPIYSGMLLLGIGFVILVPHILTVFFAVLSYVGFDLQVRKVEEPYLGNVHGERYETYCRQVGRYFPRLPRRSR